MQMPQCFRSPSLRNSVDKPFFRILAYGDSLTAGYFDGGAQFEPYGSVLAEMLESSDPAVLAEVWVCGLSGVTAEVCVKNTNAKKIFDCVDRESPGLRRLLASTDPFDLALIMMGTNDFADCIGGTSIATTVKALHQFCHDFGVDTAVLSVPSNLFVKSDAPIKAAWERCNGLLKTWAYESGAEEGVKLFVDTNEILPFSKGGEFWECDNLHFSPKGSRRLGTELARLIAPILAAATPKRTSSLSKMDLGHSSPRFTFSMVGEPMPQCCFSAAALPTDQPRRRILAYGDSLTSGYYAFGNLFSPYAAAMGPCLPAAFQAEVWSCGLSGETATNMAMKLDSCEIRDVTDRVGMGLRRILVEKGPFDLVLIMAGTNDLKSESVETILASLKVLHKACHQNCARTVALAVPPSRASQKIPSIKKQRGRLNRLLEEWCTEGEDAKHVLGFVDIDKLVPFDEDNEFWELDGLHFSRAGSRHLGVVLAPLVAPLLAAESIMVSGDLRSNDPLPKRVSVDTLVC
eukprot:TRINITY_DN42091_c0_g1_i1.p1 TRINITY_DN42091_c0_g1~~TRINITY_DN42091_c0_g1_i1.p1  ORF type:complete len:517 (-),score=64.80 TRINITY_DN42091_c0_g1_i1:164-1714(-)